MSSLHKCGKDVKIQVNYLFIRAETYPHTSHYYGSLVDIQWENGTFTLLITHLINKVMHAVMYVSQSVMRRISTQFTVPITTEYKF